MKKILFHAGLVLCIACTSSLYSCKHNVAHGRGAVTTENKSVKSFDRIEISVPADVNITVSNNAGNTLQVKTHKNLHEHIRTEVVDNVLRVYTDDLLISNDDIHLEIETPSLKKLEINGAADANIKGTVDEADFELLVRGASDVTIDNIRAGKMKVKLSGASELDVKNGSSDYSEYSVTGAGEVKASGHVCKEAKASVSGAGEMSLNVTGKLDARITGAGEIDYIGHPVITSHITGAGELNDRN